MIDWTAFITMMLPANDAAAAPVVALAIVVACKLVTVCIPPPVASSRWLPLYTLVSRVGLNIGWAVNAYQSSRSPILVPVERGSEIRAVVAQALNVRGDDTRP